MGLISVAVILLIAIFSLGLVTKKQVQRDTDAKYSDQREANEGRPFEPIGRQFDDQHMQAIRQQSTTTLYSDQQECRGMAERLHDSNGGIKR